MSDSDVYTDDIERCRLCEPANHPNCEVYTTVEISDPMGDVSGTVPVCMGHFEAIVQSLQTGTNQTEESNE